MMNKVTYLCGGINALSDDECNNWRTIAKNKLDTGTLDPMRRDYRGKEDESFKEIVRGDLQDVASCNYVIVNATRPGWGTAMEIVYAKQAKKFIVAFTEGARISPWLREHCNIICTTIDEAILEINKKAEHDYTLSRYSD